MIPIYKPWLGGNELKYVTEAVESTWISSQGGFIKEFESEFARKMNVKHAFAVNNGTAACHLALLGISIKPGDIVLVPNLTFVATANVVRYCNAIPRLCDVDADTWNMKPTEQDIEHASAMFPVHLFGNMCCHYTENYHTIPMVEDAAEAFGTRFKSGAWAGSIGKVGAFSFFGNKTLTTGEGGMVVTNDDRIAERISLFRNQCHSPYSKYWHIDVGYNYRMTNVAAAIGLAQLEKIDVILAEKQRVADCYRHHLSRCESIKFQSISPGTYSSNWMIGVQINFGADELKNVISALTKRGIETRRFFYPLHHLIPYVEYAREYNLGVSERLFRNGLVLPSYPQLSNDEIKNICSVILNYRKYM